MMARTITTAAVLMVSMLSVSMIVNANADICNVPVDDLMKCLPAVRHPPEPPTPGCCAVIGAIKPEDYPCFCQYKDNPILKVFGVDIDLVFKVPVKCGLKGVPSHC
ncbi:hypothetical protein MLD38_033703 [Melastoma candidum]|uniref:Uncharacterized protein n=1 Tax=Melastoma candidum TaxID=119954 RepID=A0ACB9M7L5_9MYRT|nr:hypothetical protein MLD38_033703 [Melastoma candidum]